MNVLVVEDDTKFARNLKKALNIEGYTVDIALDGLAGLSRGLKKRYDLIMLDVMLPKMDGMSVCGELRKHNVHSPIIMLTAKGDVRDRVAGLDSGADDYLVKPFGFEELFARLRSLLRRKRDTDQPSIMVQDLVVNTATREVRRGKKSIDLTPKEYKLLLYLLRNRNKIIERDKLAAHLWKIKPTGNQLDVHMHYLRSKIDDGYTKKIIYTLKGAGYKIEH